MIYVNAYEGQQGVKYMTSEINTMHRFRTSQIYNYDILNKKCSFVMYFN